MAPSLTPAWCNCRRAIRPRCIAAIAAMHSSTDPSTRTLAPTPSSVTRWVPFRLLEGALGAHPAGRSGVGADSGGVCGTEGKRRAGGQCRPPFRCQVFHQPAVHGRRSTPRAQSGGRARADHTRQSPAAWGRPAAVRTRPASVSAQTMSAATAIPAPRTHTPSQPLLSYTAELIAENVAPPMK